MADRHYNLNGANYGPPFQPPLKTYHSHGRRGADVGCCSICDCFSSCILCCGSCLLTIICNILIFVVVCLGIIALILWFILRPNVVKFQVTEANLTRFDLDPLNNLHYNLSLNFAIHNPNRRLGIHYDQLEASGYYGDQRFAAVNMPSFYQGHKNTTVVRTELNGQSLVLLGAGGRKDLKEDQKSGIYRIDVKLRLKIRSKFGFLNSWAVKPKIKCHLKVPLSTSTSAGGFQFHPTKCHVDL